VDIAIASHDTPPWVVSVLANAEWETLVRSMESALDGTQDIGLLTIVAGALLVLWINIRLARWIARTLGPDREHPGREHMGRGEPR